jgi:hypothetical protein
LVVLVVLVLVSGGSVEVVLVDGADTRSDGGVLWM